MPEIAEVETIKNDLIKSDVLSNKIINVEIFKTSLIKSSLDEFIKKSKNKKISNILRIGKYLIFDLGDLYLTIHLKMTGHIFLKNKTYHRKKHDHIIFHLDSNKKLIYFDPRRFGSISLKKELSFLDKLGPDILSKKFNFKSFYKDLKLKKQKIKALLLDQSFLAGLGNIYADEALFLAKIHPEKLPSQLKSKKAQDLFNSIKIVIKKAIKNRGTSLGTGRSNFSSIDEVFGLNQNHLLIHTKKTCPKCKRDVKKIKINQRTSHFCKNCQK